MTRKILKSTERGQITLPKQWRDRFPTDSFLVEMWEDRIVLMPLRIEGVGQEDILYDADRDTGGKGMSPDALIRILKKIKHG